MTINILIVEDQRIVREGLRAVLEDEDDIAIVGEAANGQEAIDLFARLRPDVVLMDLQMPVMDGPEATRRIRAAAPDARILVLTTYDTDGDILGAVEAGASGYLLKDTPPEELIAAIRAAAGGESALAPAVAGRLLARMRSPQPGLSVREIEVLRLVADGASNNDVAARLHISDATVKSHLVHVYGKLGVTSRTAAVAAARESGILR